MIRHLIFDLDDTLYSARNAMGAGIARRIIGFCAEFFGIPFEEAERRRCESLPDFENTLEWLRASGLGRVEDYFAFVHPPEEIAELAPDPALRPFLQSIPLPKIILTNAPAEHAEHVLSFFGIRDLFHPEICDIRMNALKGKPHGFAYRAALSRIGGTVADTLFLDDHVPYAAGYAALGGNAAVVGGAGAPEAAAGAAREAGGALWHIPDVYALPALLEKFL